MPSKKTGKDIAVPNAMSDKVQEALKQQFAKALDKTGGFNMFPTISMQHGIKKPGFEIEGMDDVKKFKGTIIEYTIDKQYRENKDEKRPTCSSIGGEYGSAFGPCDRCEFGQWKQIDGRNVKECKDSRRALVVMEDSDKVYEIKIPGTSVKNFDMYEKHVASKERMALGAAVTEFSLDVGTADGRKPWAILQMKFVHPITEADPAFIEKVVKGLEEYSGFYKPTTAKDVRSSSSESTKDGDETENSDENVEDADFVVGDGVEVADDEIAF